MALHKLRLYLLKRKNNFIFFSMALGMFTTLFVGMYLLVSTQTQGAEIRKSQEQNRQLLKGLSCILLILPEERSQEKIENCIRINTDNQKINYDFFFKSLEDNQTLEKENPDFIALLKKELSGERGSSGLDGEDGKDGKDGENAVSTITTVKEQVPIKGDKGDIGQAGREVEFQYNSVKDRIEWRYIGEDIWTVLVDACELTNTCLP